MLPFALPGVLVLIITGFLLGGPAVGFVVAAVLAVSAVFLEVGYSEDRARDGRPGASP
jgi:hypothetical protein